MHVWYVLYAGYSRATTRVWLVVGVNDASSGRDLETDISTSREEREGARGVSVAAVLSRCGAARVKR